MKSIIKTSALDIGFKNNNILTGVEVDIKPHCITTIVGINGSGKSTLVKSMAGIIPPLSGNIYFKNQDIKGIHPKQLAKSLAYLSQRHIAPEDVNVEELVYYGRYPHKQWFENRTKRDCDIVRHCLEVTDMVRFKHRRLNELSGGENQRAWIAMCLAQEPEVMMLDEPTTFMDIFHQIDVLELLRELNKEKKLTIVMVLHDINQAIAYSDEIIVVHDGAIYAQGKPDQVITTSVLQEVFKLKTKCIYDCVLGNTYIPYPDRKVATQ